MRFSRLFSVLCLILLFGVFFYRPTVVDARTCCVNGNDPKTCNACEPDKDYKNHGGCAGNPTCVECPADHPVANACSGGSSFNMCDLFKMTPSATLQIGQVSPLSEVVVKQGAYSKIDITTTDPSVAVASPALWGSAGLPDLGQNYTTEHKYFNVVAGAKPGVAILVAHQYATYPGYEMLYCSASMYVTVTAPTPPPTPTPVPTPTPTPTPTPVPVFTITSKIENDPALKGGDRAHTVGLLDQYCTSSDIGDAYTAGSISAFTDPTKPYKGTIDGNGKYTITSLPSVSGGYTIKLNTNNPDVICSCPIGCQYFSKNVPTTQDLKFYVSPVGSAWYQTAGGDVAAQATNTTALSDAIPSTCVESFCSPFLSLPLKNEPSSIGALITTVGSTTKLSTGRIGKDPNSRGAELSTPLVCRENYGYFYRLYSLGLSPAVDLSSSPSKPTGKQVYFYTGGAPLSIDSTWNLSSGESFVVFVKQDLHINAPIIVPKGAFLAFIVSGDITIGADVGTTDHTSAKDGQVQGVYIADGSMHVMGGGEEKKLIGEGTFAACNGIKIDRDFSKAGYGLDNNMYPSALFLYRPDLVLNTPDRMKSASYIWKEVTP